MTQMNDSNLFWFGCVLFVGIVLFLLSQLGSSTRDGDATNLRATNSRATKNARSAAQIPTSQPIPLPLQETSPQIEALQQVEALQQQCLRLRDELQHQKMQLTTDLQTAAFEQLQSLLTNYPSARQMAQAKPDLPARNFAALFTPLENLLQSWNIEAIGMPWQQTAFDPQLHQPDADDIAAGEPVYIRFVGYRQAERILCPAKVSRTLPNGVQPGESA